MSELRIRASLIGALLGQNSNMTKSQAINETIADANNTENPNNIFSEKNMVLARGVEKEGFAIEDLSLKLGEDLCDTGDAQKTYFADLDGGIRVSATPDGLTAPDKDGYVSVVEVKCPFKQHKMPLEENPQYKLQIHLQMYCVAKNGFKVKGAYYYSHFPGVEFEPIFIEYDPDYFYENKLYAEIKDVWDELQDILADPDKIGSILKLPKYIIKTPDFLDEYLRTDAQIKKLNDRKSEIIKEWDSKFGEGNKYILDEDSNVTMVISKTITRQLDTKKLKEDHGSIVLNQYYKTSARTNVSIKKRLVSIDDVLTKLGIKQEDATLIEDKDNSIK